MADARGRGRPLRRLAPAKVNLALHVTGRRADGYHTLDTLAVFADVGDELNFSPAAAVRLTLGGPFAAHAPNGPDNLAWRAAALLQEAARSSSLGAHIHIDKAIPAGAGLGGGSADAAAALLALNRLWEIGLGPAELDRLALRMGADVPMCLHGRALRARGIGEELTILSGLPPLPLVLVWPGVALETGRIFAALESRENPPLPSPPPRFSHLADLAAWLAACRNDLEEPAIRLVPAVDEALQELRSADGCLLARMSGSGSACFGLFETAAEAHSAAAEIVAAHPGWWVRATTGRDQAADGARRDGQRPLNRFP